jgi:hypothetical protein
VTRDDVQKALTFRGGKRVIAQRLCVAADRGQRRPQFVRDVGDEITPDLVSLTQSRDVVEDQHRAAIRERHRACSDGRPARQDQLRRLAVAAGHGGIEVGDDIRMSDDVQVPRRPDADGPRTCADAEHLARRIVHKLQAAVAAHHDYAFHHAGENGLGPGARVLEVRHAACQLPHGFVEGAAEFADLVFTVCTRRR